MFKLLTLGALLYIGYRLVLGGPTRQIDDVKPPHTDTLDIDYEEVSSDE